MRENASNIDYGDDYGVTITDYGDYGDSLLNHRNSPRRFGPRVNFAMGCRPRQVYGRPATVCSPGEEDVMRPIIKIAMCALVAAALAAPAPAFAASADYYLKLGDIKGETAARSGP